MTFIFKLDKAPAIIAEVLESMDWREFDPAKDSEDSWHLKWQIQR